MPCRAAFTGPRPRPLVVLLAAAALIASAAGCGSDDETSGADGKLNVVATTTQAADLVRNVGGEAVDVTQILPPNADPHDYEPRPSDARALADADLVVRSGGDVDAWLDDLVENAGGDAKSVSLLHAAEEGAALGADHKREAGGEDPHWWQDPRNAVAAVASIRGALDALDPGQARTFAANAARYSDDLQRTDRAIAACIARIPKAKRKLVTDHDAFGSYARRYGLEVVGAAIPGLSTQAQPSAGEIARLTRQIEQQGVPAIFPEESLSPDLIRAIAAQSGAKVGGALWSDTLGPAGSAGETYLGSLQANTRAIVAGLAPGRRCAFPAA